MAASLPSQKKSTSPGDHAGILPGDHAGILPWTTTTYHHKAIEPQMDTSRPLDAPIAMAYENSDR